MPNSKRIGAIVGPTIVAMVVSEFPLVQPHLYTMPRFLPSSTSRVC
jgi:hypothetical protein